jgi:molybdopterin molybdotransferase
LFIKKIAADCPAMARFLTLQPVEAILDRIREFSPLPAENIPLAACPGRILAAPFKAPEDLPGFDRSTMDGFAARAKDTFGASESMPALLDYAGECPMGEAPGLSIKPGQTARIWTGGMLPGGADAVVPLEYSRVAGDRLVELTRPAAPFDCVISRGEDARKGEELLPAGRVLRPQELGLLAALGQQTACVRQKPKVAVISTGDEIVPVTDLPAPGQVRDINSHTLVALAEAAGGEGRALGIVRDSLEELRSRVAHALEWADVLLLSGGSSAGRRDFTINAFHALPGVEILAHGVAISPGKPLILARRAEKSLWGMPGHAASALICAEVFIRPLLYRLSGREEGAVRIEAPKAVLSRPVASAQGRRDYIRVRLSPPAGPGGMLTATPIMGKSGLINTLVMTDALIVCPENQEGLDAGALVDLHFLL